MDQIHGKRFVTSFLRMGKYEHPVNGLQKHMKAVVWCNPNSSAPANHFFRTGWGLPQHILWATTCSVWQWPIRTCQLALGWALCPTSPAGACGCVWGLRTGGTNLNIGHIPNLLPVMQHLWQKVRWLPWAKNLGTCALLQFICHSKKSTRPQALK